MILQVPAYITKLETTADGGVKLIVHTQELDPSQGGIIFQLKNKHGYFLFQEKEFSEEDVKGLPDFVPEFKGEKSPSQRLRGVLFRVHEANGGRKEDFDAFYRKQMEVLIEHFKEKLNP